MSKLKNKKITITGGAGFIGSNLIKYFIKNNRIYCIDNFSTGFRQNIEEFVNHENFNLIEGDIRDTKSCEVAISDSDIIFHQAALGSVPRSIKDPNQSNDVNVSGFLNILFLAQFFKVDRVVYASSSSVYGDCKDEIKEEHRIGEPLSPYAITKYCNELYAKNFSKIYNDFNSIGLRYFNVFGEKQNPKGEYAAVIPKFINSLLNKQSPTINGDGSNSRDFTYIQNVVRANELAALANPSALNGVYNIACGKTYNLNSLFKLIKENLVTYDPSIEEIKPIYGPPREGDILHSLASIKMAEKCIRYKPEVEFDEGIKRTVEWFWKKSK